jgi:hypothetical protein
MNKKQKTVLDWAKGKDDSPLRFKNEDLNRKLIKSASLNKLVFEILEAAHEENSYSADTFTIRPQCYAKKWRSVFDIWRHVKYFKPRITLVEVMNSLAEISDDLVGHYCTTIHRRVFMSKRPRDGYTLNCTISKDEFGLRLEEWKGIDKE